MQLNPGLGIGMGRNRKVGKRYPSGKLIPVARAPDDRVRASRQPHRRSLPTLDLKGNKIDRMSYKAESPLGRANLRGEITDAQYEAGVRYRNDVGAYRTVIESPAATGGSGRGSACILMDPHEETVIAFGKPITLRSGSCWDNPDQCGCRRIKDNCNGAFESMAHVGQRAQKAVKKLAVHGEELSELEMACAKLGLNALEQHYGLTNHAKKSYYRNTN